MKKLTHKEIIRESIPYWIGGFSCIPLAIISAMFFQQFVSLPLLFVAIGWGLVFYPVYKQSQSTPKESKE